MHRDMCFCTERPPFRLWTCGLQCAECKDFSVCAGSQVERGNLRNSDSTFWFLLSTWEGRTIPFPNLADLIRWKSVDGQNGKYFFTYKCKSYRTTDRLYLSYSFGQFDSIPSGNVQPSGGHECFMISIILVQKSESMNNSTCHVWR